jgi:UDP-N-acetylglucosamine 2-epimerase (non-hydrolysing)
MKIDLIAGARPNFMKIAPIIDAIRAAQKNGENISYRLIHTGQHYDQNMSGSFFEQLGIPEPNVNLGAGGGTQAQQTASIMVGYEELLMKESTDLCLVVGDVTSTMACSIVAHDSITNYFFTTTEVANESLWNSGISKDRIFWAGNTMIDTLLKRRSRFSKPAVWDAIGLQDGNYLVMTLHRPANVDEEGKLKQLIDEIIAHSNGLPLVFPVHSRTAKILENLGISYPCLHMIEPLGYLEFNYLVERAKAVVTDSGGITEETTVMGVPCMTLRDNTERPETVDVGTNELIGTNPKSIKPALEKLFAAEWKKGAVPELWDGNYSRRIVSILKDLNVTN